MTGKFRKLPIEALRLIRASAAYRANPAKTLARYWDLYRHRSFAPDEIHFFQMLDPRLTEEDLSRVVSKEELLQLQLRLNPRESLVLTEDKLSFHAHCVRHGLPVPRIFAIYDPNGASVDAVGSSLRDPAAIERFLLETEANTLIFKPVDGVNGEGVSRLQRHDECWTDTEGRAVDASAIASTIATSGYRRWMFQEFVQGHPALCELSQTSGLQTVRAVTAVDRQGRVKILATRLRLICGNVAFDNFNYGTTGNVIANVDVDTGEIRTVVANRDGVLTFVENHPKTGTRLIGYRVPQWDAVRSLAERAAIAHLPLRTVGWDIGIALPEPSLIEGNATWGILSGERRMGEIYRFLQTLLPD